MKNNKAKAKKIFAVGITSIRGDFGKKINDKIKESDNSSNLSDYEKRIAILKEENSSTYNSNNKNSFEIKDTKEIVSQKENNQKYDIKTDIIKKENEKIIEKECNKINDNNISDFEKRTLVLKSEKTTTIHTGENKLNINKNESNAISSEQNIEHEERKEEERVNPINESSFEDAPTADTSSQIKNNSCENHNLTFIQEKTNPNFNSFDDKEIKKFSEARQAYLLKLHLNDISLNYKNTLQPEKYKLGHSQYIFAYPNDTNTYCITISEKIKKIKKIETQKDLIQDKNYCKSLGLFFCGKFIEEFKMKCAPNQFMCKECMKINKVQYNLDKNYLINMNGRVAKMQKGSYYCCGIFKGEKESNFGICAKKFTCKSCNILNLYSNYYSS